MSSYPQYDLTMPTRDQDEVRLTTASFTREGVAEVVISELGGANFGATIITAAQARVLATAFDKLATFWGE